MKTFIPGDELVITVKNESHRPAWIELVGTSARGRKVILTHEPIRVAPGQSYRFPPKGGITIRGGVGKELVCVWLVCAISVSNRPGVTKANLNRVQDGMTLERVKELLGDNHELCGMGRPWAFTEVWTGDAGQLAFVTFRCHVVDGKFGEPTVVGTDWTGSFMANLEKYLDWIR